MVCTCLPPVLVPSLHRYVVAVEHRVSHAPVERHVTACPTVHLPYATPLAKQTDKLTDVLLDIDNGSSTVFCFLS